VLLNEKNFVKKVTVRRVKVPPFYESDRRESEYVSRWQIQVFNFGSVLLNDEKISSLKPLLSVTERKKFREKSDGT
jgi:hypothetical protein